MKTPWTDLSERTALMKELELRPQEIDLRRTARIGSPPPIGQESVVPLSSATIAGSNEQTPPLFSLDEAKRFRDRWDTIQVGFVDEPRRAVEEADSLVAEAMQRLVEMLAVERAKIDGPWDRQSGVSTEDLRLDLRRYQSFIDRLLSV